MSYVKIENKAQLVRDINSNAVLNSDKDALVKYKAARAKRLNTSVEFDRMKKDIDNIKNDLYEIKTLLVNMIKD
jgi:hypothetical protein